MSDSGAEVAAGNSLFTTMVLFSTLPTDVSHLAPNMTYDGRQCKWKQATHLAGG